MLLKSFSFIMRSSINVQRINQLIFSDLQQKLEEIKENRYRARWFVVIIRLMCNLSYVHYRATVVVHCCKQVIQLSFFHFLIYYLTLLKFSHHYKHVFVELVCQKMFRMHSKALEDVNIFCYRKHHLELRFCVGIERPLWEQVKNA